MFIIIVFSLGCDRPLGLFFRACFASFYTRIYVYCFAVTYGFAVMELRPLTSQQSLAAISWLSAQPLHMVEHLTS